jgi:hypothetical protein
MDTLTLFRLWHSGMTNAELAFALGCSRSALYAIRRRHKLPARPADTARPTKVADPTEEQIAEMCAAFRAAWSDEERQERVVGRRRVEWSMPAYRFNRVEYAFTPE